ncbi:polymerase [Streptococcus parasuis]|uniref:polymerase n=1 Tax=Streptococcus parasuis TaxID=1501662 RepID=UPI0028ACC38D|nr:polymerase [Streptococcus parasuis]
MKIKLNKRMILCIILYIGLIISVISMPSFITLGYSIVFIGITTFLNFSSIVERDYVANSFFISLPILISAFQNIYLGLGANKLNSITMQVLLTISIAVIVSTVFIGILSNKFISKDFTWLIVSSIIIILQSIILLAVFPTTIAAYLSSMRNILSPLLIFFFSVYSFKNVDLNRVYKYFSLIIFVILIFGVIEYVVGNSIWSSLNIKQLWALKGMPIENRIVPGNWYSSELVGGNQLRRMVSTFADPVNLGSFLFAAYMFAWYFDKKILQIGLLISFVLSVSKGAFLSFLVFVIVFSWIKDRTKIFGIFGLVISTIAGGIFYLFSQSSSYGSMNAHIDGFLSALSIPIHYPLGMGVGSVGVLASKLGSEAALSSEVLETGIGMIIAQLGFVGVIIYATFFIKLSSFGKKFKEKNDKIMWFTLLYGFLANAMFNEVALSPNSCALYFIMLGMLYNKINNEC